MRIWKIISIAVVALFFLLAVFTSIWQTDWGRKKYLTQIEKTLAKKNIKVSFEGLSGFLPFAWKVKEATVVTPTTSIQLEDITFRLNLLGLLHKKIVFRDVDAKKVIYSREGMESFPPFAVSGRVSLSQNSSSVDLTATREENSFHIIAKVRNGQVKVKAECKVLTLKSLAPWYSHPFDSSFSFITEWRGSQKAFQNLLFQPGDHLPIVGDAHGVIYHTENLLPELIQTHLKDLSLHSHFTLYSDRSLHISMFDLFSPSLSVHTKGDFTKNFRLEKIDGTFLVNNLAPFGLEGNLFGTGTITYPNEEYLGEFSIQGELIKDRFNVQNIQMQAHSKTLGKNTTGSFALTASLFSEDWRAEGEFILPEKGDLMVSPVRIYSPFAELHGKIALGNERRDGEATFRIDDLYHLQPFFPEYPFYGGVEGRVHYIAKKTEGNWENTFEGSGNLFDVFYKNLHADEIYVDSEMINKKGNITVSFDRLRYHTLFLNNVTFKTNNEEENWPFTLNATGSFRAPLDIIGTGYWHKKNGDFLVNLQEFSGHLFNHSFSMQKPWEVNVTPHSWKASELELNMAVSKLIGSASVTSEECNFQLTLDHFPLDFLSLNPLDLDVQGFVSLEGKLKQKGEKVEGNLQMDIENIQTAALGEKIQSGAGFLTMNVKNQDLQFDGQILLQEGQIIGGKGKIPIHLNTCKHTLSFPMDKPIQAEIHYDARAEEVLDFINTGPHRFEGDVNCHLYFSRTFEHPLIHGNCTIKNGTYENYYTGTNLKDIQASLVGDKDTLVLESLSGVGQEKGNFLGKGKFRIEPIQHYPFTLQVEFNDLVIVDIPLVIASAEGKIDVNGNKKTALAEGTINVTKADFTIPSKLPHFIPTLDVAFINEPMPKAKERVLVLKKRPYPLHLDLNIHAPNNIFISGRGLTSEWHGDFKVGGTYDNIAAMGKLELMNGDFVFASKAFSLVEGALTFTGEPSTPPYLDLTGKIDVKGIAIFANLKGELTGPRLTLHSTPAMPISAMLSYLIFGSDISEISPIQAGQLAAVALTLAGEGPNLMEIARKKLGLDRLVVSTTPTKEGEEKPAIQVGKYLTKGILFTVSQGLDPSMGHISVEIDLTHGIIFEAEIIPQQEQGKFTVKWNLNY